MSGTIASIAELEACIGVAPLPVRMKIIDHIDAEARGWLGASPIAFVAVGTEDGPRVALAGAGPGFVEVRGPGLLAVPRGALDPVGPLEAGRGAGVLSLIPGVGETLRANGRIATVTDSHLEIAVEECFVHCAKALIRSDFWTGGAGKGPATAVTFVNATRFLALATMDAHGRIDISPKGDPAGLLIQMRDDRAALAERPGNKLAFGYRNMIADPRVAVLGLIPGVAQAVAFEGRAQLTTYEPLRAGFAVDGKAPILATIVEGVRPRLVESPALARAALWACPAPKPTVDPAAVFVAHVKLNKAQGAAAALLRLSASRGLVASGLKTNYRTELY